MAQEFYIRADANSQIATGHVMRCMSIAEALERRRNYRCIFIMADHEGEALLKGKYSVICLNSQWNRLDDETEKMEALIRDRGIERLLIDSYFVTEDYLKRINSLTKTFYIDDLDRFLYPVDTVINYSIYADSFDYEKRYRQAGMNTRFLLGCEYAPLRSEFREVSCLVREQVNNILITTGGTDHYNVAGRLAEKVMRSKEFKDITVHIVAGAYNKNKEQLKQLGSSFKRVELHENVTEMAKLMAFCDIAITAGGTTTYELCACGIPSIAIALADNQLNNVKRFAEEGLLLYAGDITRNKAAVLETVFIYLQRLIKSRELRQQFFLRMQSKEIKNGSEHIAEALL
jgi:pseudaminic acid biosynthesis-associated protein PseG